MENIQTLNGMPTTSFAANDLYSSSGNQKEEKRLYFLVSRIIFSMPPTRTTERKLMENIVISSATFNLSRETDMRTEPSRCRTPLQSTSSPCKTKHQFLLVSFKSKKPLNGANLQILKGRPPSVQAIDQFVVENQNNVCASLQMEPEANMHQ